jgi:hypothetical protein
MSDSRKDRLGFVGIGAAARRRAGRGTRSAEPVTLGQRLTQMNEGQAR